jgi:hypothetical protein
MNGTSLSVTRAMRLMPADDHHADEGGEDDPEDDAGGAAAEGSVVAARDGLHLREGLVGLERVAAAQRAEDAEDGEGRGEHLAEAGLALLGQATGQVEHRSAGDRAVRVLAPVLHAQGALGELGRHPEQTRDDHPERRTGTAQRDGDRHAGDVAEPDGPGHRGGEGLEVRDLTHLVGPGVVALDELDGVLEAAEVDPAEVDGEDDGGECEPPDDERELHAATFTE